MLGTPSPTPGTIRDGANAPKLGRSLKVGRSAAGAVQRMTLTTLWE